jgi:hypothetical protein
VPFQPDERGTGTGEAFLEATINFKAGYVTKRTLPLQSGPWASCQETTQGAMGQLARLRVAFCGILDPLAKSKRQFTINRREYLLSSTRRL